MTAIITFFSVAYLIAQFWNWIYTGISPFSVTEYMAIFNTTGGFMIAQTTQDWGQYLNPMFYPQYFETLWKIATLDLPLFSGAPWLQVLRFAIGYPGAVCLVCLLVFGFISVVQSIFS